MVERFIRSSVLDMLNLRGLWDTQRPLDIQGCKWEIEIEKE